jgi:hypothetical protein
VSPDGQIVDEIKINLYYQANITNNKLRHHIVQKCVEFASERATLPSVRPCSASDMREALCHSGESAEMQTSTAHCSVPGAKNILLSVEVNIAVAEQSGSCSGSAPEHRLRRLTPVRQRQSTFQGGAAPHAGPGAPQLQRHAPKT